MRDLLASLPQLVPHPDRRMLRPGSRPSPGAPQCSGQHDPLQKRLHARDRQYSSLDKDAQGPVACLPQWCQAHPVPFAVLLHFLRFSRGSCLDGSGVFQQHFL